MPHQLTAAFDELDKLTHNNVEAIIRRHPASWISDSQSNAIVAWWQSGNAGKRTDEIRAGMKNGKIF